MSTKEELIRLTAVIEKARQSLEQRIHKGAVTNAREADEAAAEIVGELAEQHCYQMHDARYETLMAAMMEQAGISFPGNWPG